MRIPTDTVSSAKCAMCCSEAIMECVECLRQTTEDAPSFCSAVCLKKHFGLHRQGTFNCKRSSSSSGSSSSISSGSSSPSLSGSEPSSPQSPAPVLLSRGPQHWQQHSPAHHYMQQFMHMQPPPPRGYAPVMHGHRHVIEVGGPAPHWQQHHRRR